MKRLSLLVCALSVVLLISSAAMAQQPQGRQGQGRGRPGQGRRGEGAPGRGGPGRGGPGRFLPPILQALDADGNGVISKEEIAGAVAALKKLDEDGDGQLTREEYMGRGPAGPGRGGPGRGGPGGRAGAGGAGVQQFIARLKEADANGDGKISKEEAPDRLKQAFDRIDTNSDGQLDDAELRALAERIGRGRAGRGGRGGEGGRGGAGRRGGGRPDGDNN